VNGQITVSKDTGTEIREFDRRKGKCVCVCVCVYMKGVV